MNEAIKSLLSIVGERHVITDADALAPYQNDATGNYTGRAMAAVRPATTAEVSRIVKLANQLDMPIVPQGGNTGLTGATYTGSERPTIILSLSRMNSIRAIRPEGRLAIVEAGVILENLHKAVGQHDLIFPLVFGARGSCMIGGNLATNAGGSNVLRYGNTRDLVLGIEAVMPNGDIVNLMSELHKDNSGYNLKHLLIGSEGTLGIITAAVLKLAQKPRSYVTASVSVRHIAASLSLLNRLNVITANSVEAFEYMPRRYFDLMAARFPEMRAPFETPAEHVIFLEIGTISPADTTPLDDGSLPIANRIEAEFAERLEAGDILDAVICQSEAQRLEMWERRDRALEIAQSGGRMISNDISVAVDKVQTFLTLMNDRLPKALPRAESLAIAHLGDGNVHYSVWVNPGSDAAISAQDYECVVETVEETVFELGGSFSAEHGIGKSKLSSMARRKDAGALSAMRTIKFALDPNNIMNPGKVLPPDNPTGQD